MKIGFYCFFFFRSCSCALLAWFEPNNQQQTRNTKQTTNNLEARTTMPSCDSCHVSKTIETFIDVRTFLEDGLFKKEKHEEMTKPN